MKIKLKTIDLWATISKIHQLAKFDNNRIYFSPVDGEQLYVYCGSPSVALARKQIKAEIVGEPVSFWVSLAKLHSFLSVLDGNEYLDISVAKQASFSYGKQRLLVPIDIDLYSTLRIDNDDGVRLASITPSQFKVLASVSKVSKNDSGVYSGTLFISDGTYLRALSADGYGVAYSWIELKSDYKGTFLIPAIALELLTSKIWEEAIQIRVVRNSHVVLSSKSLTISAIQMSNKDKFPYKIILQYLDGNVRGMASVNIADLAAKLSACGTIKFAPKGTQSVARIEFTYSNTEFEIESFENGEKMTFDVMTKALPNCVMNFVLDGSFVNTAIKILSSFGDVPYIQIGEAQTQENWVVFQAENTNAIFAFAKMVKDYK